jgi:hypothetical protein
MTPQSLTFRTATGETVSLESFMTSEHLVLLFLRHLA